MNRRRIPTIARAALFLTALSLLFAASLDPGWGVGGSLGQDLISHPSKTTEASIATNSDLHSVDFVSDQVGWIVGSAGLIIKTTDGGSTWNSQTSFGNTLTSVDFVNSSTGWAVGGAGLILNTTDGGTTWTPQTSSAIDALLSVFFLDGQKGWITGRAGLILVTENGGSSWSSSVNTSNDLNSVFFVNQLTGWAVGDHGTILKTTNGGSTWNAQASNTTSGLISVYFTDSQTGWAVGIGGTVLKTANGGSSWASLTSGTTEHLESVKFSGSLTGWATGFNGTIIKTIDGGTTWTSQTSGTTSTLWSVFFANSSTGWAVGDRGTVVKTSAGGTTWTDPTSRGETPGGNKVYLPYAPKSYTAPVSDDFSDPTSGWTVLATDLDSRGYDSGEYRIFIKSGNNLLTSFRELYATDLQVEIDVRAAGPTNGDYGIHFGSTNVGLYAFLVSSGQYLLGRYDFSTNTWTYLINWTVNSSVLTGNNTNHLKVVRMGPTISLYANGQLLAQVSDSTFGTGYVGPAAGGFAPNFEARFDNFRLIYTPAAP